MVYTTDDNYGEGKSQTLKNKCCARKSFMKSADGREEL